MQWLGSAVPGWNQCGLQELQSFGPVLRHCNLRYGDLSCFVCHQIISEASNFAIFNSHRTSYQCPLAVPQNMNKMHLFLINGYSSYGCYRENKLRKIEHVPETPVNFHVHTTLELGIRHVWAFHKFGCIVRHRRLLNTFSIEINFVV